MLLRIIARLRTNLRNSIKFSRHIFSRNSIIDEKRRAVFFDISDPRLERYLYWLLKMFDISGWKVSLKLRPWLLLNLRNWADLIYDIDSLDIRLTAPDDCDLKVSDKKRSGSYIYLDTNYFSEFDLTSSFKLPFFMYPVAYNAKLNSKAITLRDKTRSVRVFYGGNISSMYENPDMQELFGVADRSEVIAAIRERFRGSSMLTEIYTKDEANGLPGAGPLQIVGLQANILALEDWFDLLSISDFFIAPPGVIMPFSHNIIEAMSVGCIPITQYARYFCPRLVNGENCIEFSDTTNLVHIIEWILGLSEEEIIRLRRNVIEYYDRYLDPVAIVRTIDESREDIKTLKLIAGHNSVSKLKAELGR